MKKIFLTLLFGILVLFQANVIAKDNCTENSSSQKLDKKYSFCCSNKKGVLKSARCKDVKCIQPTIIQGGLGKPAIYLYNPSQAQLKKPAIYLYPGTIIGRKPAVYFYPKKPLKVNITLDESVKITYDAPKYVPDKGWNVLLYPDGKIKDSQPEYTNCNAFDQNKFGLEYAQKACQKNNYPYVFWEGVCSRTLPVKNEGWVVKKEDLNKFLKEKLEYIGFNKKEKAEFLDFWVKILTDRPDNQYQIYFAQTKEVDYMAPMQVIPKPDSINRIYMVVKTLQDQSNLSIKPQNLEKFKRDGFTLVEWGGTILDKADMIY